MSISVSKKNVEYHVESVCSLSPRYAGTEGEVKTRGYIVSEGKKLGISVELEEFEYLHYSSKFSKLETLTPVEEDLCNLPLFYAGNGVAEGEVVHVGSGAREEFELLGKLGVDIEGKIVLASNTRPFLVYPVAQQYGASGLVILTDAPDNLCRGGTATVNREPGEIPAVLVPVAVEKKLLALMSTGRLRLRVTSEGAFSRKTSSNIIMTMPGATIPGEQVILAAHYDSLDLGEHACDNATGCAALLELARIFSELKADRTIRIIFFGVEELGTCWGSFSYVDKHASELSSIRAVVICDGMGLPYDFKFDLMASTKEIRAYVANIVQELGHNIKGDVDPLLAFSDNLHFQMKGVPAVWLKGNQGIFHHTAGDDQETLDHDKLKWLADIDGEIIYRIATQKRLPF